MGLKVAMDQIVISFPPEIEINRQAILQLVNQSLIPIKRDVLSWNAFVDVRTLSNSNEYMLVARCDNEEIRSHMQLLLNVALNTAA